MNTDPNELRIVAVEPQPVLKVGSLTITGVLPADTGQLEAGHTREVAGVRLLALPGPDPEHVVLVVGHAGRTSVWAPHDGALTEAALEALRGARLDTAVLALAPPDEQAEQDRQSGQRLARTVAELRRLDALAPHAEVVVLIGRSTPGAEQRLRRRLSAWGLTVAQAGLSLLTPGAPQSPAPRRTLVLGAASSGKSALAEELLAAEPEVTYLATGPTPDQDDPDWALRIDRHRRRRPPWWVTLEGGDLAQLLVTPGPPVLLDSLGTWVTAALTAAGAWDDEPGWATRYEKEVDDVVRAWSHCARRVVAVGEETGWGVVPHLASGRRFRDALGALARRLADHSDQVLLVVAGRVVDLDQVAAAR